MSNARAKPSPPTAAIRCAIYTRQSRSRAGVASSCQTQHAICADFAREQRWKLTDESFEDAGESSESLDRPALQRLLREIERGHIDRIVVYSLDRLTRKLSHLQQLLERFDEHGVELRVVTDPHFGESAAHRLTSNIIAAASEFQLDMTRERMAESRAALKSKGRRVAGRIPFGYRAEDATKQLDVHRTEAAIVRRVFKSAAGSVRPQIIAERLNQEKVPGVGGRVGRWSARQILKILSNPVYAGAVRDKASTRRGRHEAIIAPEVFDQVRKCIEARRSRVPGRTTPKFPWPLRGLLVCAECGRVMSPSISGYKQFAFRYYRCRSRAFGRPPCKDVGISAYMIEEFVRAALNSDSGLSAHAPCDLSEFVSVWKQLDDRQQTAALVDVVHEVRFDPKGGRITITIAPHAIERLRGIEA